MFFPWYRYICTAPNVHSEMYISLNKTKCLLFAELIMSELNFILLGDTTFSFETFYKRNEELFIVEAFIPLN